MITILWLVGVLALFFGAILLVPNAAANMSKKINNIIFAIDSELKLRTGFAISSFLVAGCAFFLIYYYSR